MKSGGIDVLIDANRRKPNPWNRVEEAIEMAVAASSHDVKKSKFTSSRLLLPNRVRLARQLKEFEFLYFWSVLVSGRTSHAEILLTMLPSQIPTVGQYDRKLCLPSRAQTIKLFVNQEHTMVAFPGSATGKTNFQP